MTTTTRTPPVLCPHCGYAIDAASPLQSDARPEPGDWSLCLRCAGVAVFDAALRMTLPPFGAFEALRFGNPVKHAAIERARAAIREQRRTDPIPDRGGRA